MTSTPESRLAEIEDTNELAYNEYENNYNDVDGPVLENLWNNKQTAQALLYKAANAILDKNGDNVEAAYIAAQSANSSVKAAITNGESVPARITKVTNALDMGKNLLDSAATITASI